MRRASANGLHRRWYQKNRREKIERNKEYNRKKNPLIGLKAAISNLDRSGDWENFEREFERAALFLIKGLG